jgi:hypothetical protein
VLLSSIGQRKNLALSDSELMYEEGSIGFRFSEKITRYLITQNMIKDLSYISLATFIWHYGANLM